MSSFFPDVFLAFDGDCTLSTASKTQSGGFSKMITFLEKVTQLFHVNYLALNVVKSCFFIFSRVSKDRPDFGVIHASRDSLNRAKDC